MYPVTYLHHPVYAHGLYEIFLSVDDKYVDPHSKYEMSRAKTHFNTQLTKSYFLYSFQPKKIRLFTREEVFFHSFRAKYECFFIFMFFEIRLSYGVVTHLRRKIRTFHYTKCIFSVKILLDPGPVGMWTKTQYCYSVFGFRK